MASSMPCAANSNGANDKLSGKLFVSLFRILIIRKVVRQISAPVGESNAEQFAANGPRFCWPPQFLP